MNKRRIYKLLFSISLLAICLVIIIAYILTGLLVKPNHTTITRMDNNLNCIDISFNSKSGSLIKGWFIKGEIDSSAIILLHGNGGNRRSMISRAEFLNKYGYSILMFDFSAHGESIGKYRTVGYLESYDVRAAVDFLRDNQNIKNIGVIGISLGGAAALLGESPLNVNALIIESVYSTIEKAVSNRLKMKLGDIGSLFTNLIISQIKPRLGISAEQLRPIDKIKNFAKPIFIIAGNEDKRTTLEESERLFENANEPKQFWQIDGAAHIDFHKYKKEEYEKRVLNFLNRYL